ncbi:short-chain dehydrogenase [Aspergillus eucalypticola CBS 122712]|uniref:Short-chain dehydrogenase n=1 Tax=Aspergillus eucalypticola (strain CBS 122712 / IBT 29274) TaxID=1448314 RepID=A0A317VAC4_ASPEC|nr:short-chain dehydrogenase [Aspergillus eucalypticola CBS 122712]PWY69928.1 short-chain dehydrogenase [Aspergillus eucalypticola CBS 122712]
MSTPNPTTMNFISINKLTNTRVLLIGGTSGIGFAVARAALEHGASIILSSSKAEKVQSAISRLQQLYPDPSFTSRITGKAYDLSDQSTLETTIISLLDYATSPSIFPNNTNINTNTNTNTTSTTEGDDKKKILLNHIIYTSGTRPSRIPISPTTTTLTPQFYTQSQTLRVLAPLMLGKYAKSYMVDEHTSSMTFTSGVLASKPVPGTTLGAMAGSALGGLVRGLAVELAPIRANVVAPGAVETEIFDELGVEERKAVKEMFRKGTVLGRVAEPGDVAEAYVWCMKDGFVSGQWVGSDGGLCLSLRCRSSTRCSSILLSYDGFLGER